MIKRNMSNVRGYTENLNEAQLVGAAGINTSKPCNDNTSFVDMCNLDVDSDGGLTLRKPLIWKEDLIGNVSGYTYDNNFKIYIIQTDYNVGYRTAVVRIKNLDTEQYENICLKYTKYDGTVVTMSGVPSCLISGILESAKILNTSTSTIISNLKIYTDSYMLIDPTQDPPPDKYYEYTYRYLRLYKDESDLWILEIVNPEINVLTSAESAVLNPNLTLENAYALRDNYNATSVGVTNILAYAISDTGTSKPNVKEDATFDIYTIQGLTEKLAGISPRILSSLKKDSTFPVCLKAFIDVQPSEDVSYICLWEKTFDGITWEEVPEFVTDNYVLLEIPDVTNSNESLASSGTYKTLKKVKIFNPQNNEELVINRPDCLILNTFDNATYRFTIYSCKIENYNLLFSEVALKLDNSEQYLKKYSNTDYYRSNIFVESHREETERFFEIKYTVQNSSDIDFTKFEIRIFSEKNTYLLKNTDLQFTSVSNSNDIVLKGSFTQSNIDNFFEMVPTIISIYYDGKVYNDIKIMFCRYVQCLLNENGVVFENTQNIYGFKKYEPFIEGDTLGDLQALPKPLDILDTLFNIFGFSETEIYATSVFWITFLQEPEKNYEKRNVHFNLAVQNLKIIKNTTYIDNVFDSSIQTGLRIPLNANFLFLKTVKGTYSILMYSDSLKNKELTIEDYENLATVSTSFNPPIIHQEVNVAKNRPFENSIVEVKLNLGFQSYTFNFTNNVEFIYSDVPNTVQGEKYYYKKAIYTYGKDFGPNIYPTYTNSFITPLFNVIDLDITGSTFVTALTSWRDYLVACTENTIHLVTKTSEGYYTKIVNSFIGVPYKDRRTCKSILNGVVFKSGDKIYSLSPNPTSSDDTILNISELSKPIEGLIPNEDFDTFAFSTEKAYYLFIPQESQTTCFKYEYTRKVWTKFVYPVRLIDYKIFNVEDIRVFSATKEFYFNKDLNEIYTDAVENIRYGDYLNAFDVEDINNSYTGYIENSNIEFATPIEFYINSGQKTDQMSTTKQFKETKIVLATLHNKDAFPINIDVYIDGTSHIVHTDLNTDSALWKTSTQDVGAVNMTLTTSTSNLYNVIRQMYIRYSGKGKTVQHYISGVSYFNFKIYMLKYRYKLLNVKQ